MCAKSAFLKSAFQRYKMKEQILNAREIAKPYALWSCILCLCLGIALLPLVPEKSIKNALQPFYIMCMLLCLGIESQKIKILMRYFYPIMCLCLLVVVLALFSMQYSVDVGNTKESIRRFLLEPMLFMCATSLLILQLQGRHLRICGYICICIMLIHIPAILYDYYFLHHHRATGFGYEDIIVYGLWILILLALSLSLILGRYKLFGITCFIFALWALYANGTRGLMVAFVFMLFAGICARYRHRKKNTSCRAAGLCVCRCGLLLNKQKCPKTIQPIRSTQ